MSDKLYETNEQCKKFTKKRFLQGIKDRLKRIISKKFQTSFIFSIVEFENVFGPELWGYGKSEEELTSAQKMNRQRWNQVRTNILNKGHAQARAVLAEIDLHDFDYSGYHGIFVMEDKDND